MPVISMIPVRAGVSDRRVARGAPLLRYDDSMIRGGSFLGLDHLLGVYPTAACSAVNTAAPTANGPPKT